MDSTKIEEYKYFCEKCKFGCNVNSRWQRHIITELHINGKKKIRSDCKEPSICLYCNFETKNKQQFNEHYLNYHSTIEERKKEFKYYCNLCDYGTFALSFIENHNNTTKHKRHIINK